MWCAVNGICSNTSERRIAGCDAWEPLGLVKRRHYDRLRETAERRGGSLASNIRALKHAAMESYLSNQDSPTPEQQVLDNEATRASSGWH